jgi:hypothetical protein
MTIYVDKNVKVTSNIGKIITQWSFSAFFVLANIVRQVQGFMLFGECFWIGT